jgi:hypothetical protein
MGEFFSYGRQTAHYFDRPHDALPTGPIASDAAWRGPDVARKGDWRFVLDDAHVEELEAALARATATGRPLEELRADDFPLPSLGSAIDDWRSELECGRGFVLVSGVPVDGFTPEEVERLYWCLGLHMGSPGAQNVMGETLGHVVDTGDDATDPFVRLYRTATKIRYHCDAADVVALLCLQTAKRGGRSRIVSSVSVFNELMRRREDLVPRLFEAFHLDVRNEDTSGTLRHIPIPPCRFADGRLRTFYHSDYFRSVVRHDDIGPFTDEEQELLDVYEEIANDPAIYLEMDLARGDIQWLSNHSILHARTEYEDYGESKRKRHLLRLWLSIP